MYKVETAGGLIIHVETLEALREVVRSLSEINAATTPEMAAISTPAESPPAPSPPPASAPVPKNVPKGARYAPTEVKVRSVSTEEALFKLYKKLENATHQDALRFLASKGEKGASVEELKEALKLPEKYKLGGLTAAIRRRAPHYGLEHEQVLIVEFRGIVAGSRILEYKLGGEMLAMMQARGLTWKTKGGKERES